jgi:hypothetical protein
VLVAIDTDVVGDVFKSEDVSEVVVVVDVELEKRFPIERLAFASEFKVFGTILTIPILRKTRSIKMITIATIRNAVLRPFEVSD